MERVVKKTSANKGNRFTIFILKKIIKSTQPLLNVFKRDCAFSVGKFLEF